MRCVHNPEYVHNIQIETKKWFEKMVPETFFLDFLCFPHMWKTQKNQPDGRRFPKITDLDETLVEKLDIILYNKPDIIRNK